MYDSILKDFSLEDKFVINCYPYGSRVYGTNSFKSDYDFIIVVDNSQHDKDSMDSSYHNYNATIYSENSFNEQLNNHKIGAFECISLDKELCLKHTKSFNIKINKNILRESISEKASHSFVKAKKKFEVEKDKNIYIAKKSLFHSLRIINFGIQIAKNNKITDFSSSNYLWEEISNFESEDWNFYKSKYQKVFNELISEFRLLAPKKI